MSVKRKGLTVQARDGLEKPRIKADSGELAVVTWLGKHSVVVFLMLVAIGSLRIISTYQVFSHTFDEPAHIACGMEWLVQGTYQYEPQHPPLARLATAIGPYLASGRLQKLPTMAEEGLANLNVKKIWDAGLAILYRNGQYDRNLMLARLGILPFFWIASLVVYLWAKRYLGEPGAAFAVLMFTFLPPILAHAGLATTDMALTAFVGASFLMALFWLENPTVLRSILLGLITGLAVLSKFSALPFVPVSLLAALVWYFLADRAEFLRHARATKQYLLPIGLAALAGFLLIWTGYRFSFGHVTFTSLRLPAPEIVRRDPAVIDHNRSGDPSFLLGDHSNSGWWYYYCVVLAVKTPFPFLALLLYGAVAVKSKQASRGVWLALAFSLGILCFSLFSHINLGVRHILPVYVGFSIVAAAGAQQLLKLASSAKWAGWASLVLTLDGRDVGGQPSGLPRLLQRFCRERARKGLGRFRSGLGPGKWLSRVLKEVGAPGVAFDSVPASRPRRARFSSGSNTPIPPNRCPAETRSPPLLKKRTQGF